MKNEMLYRVEFPVTVRTPDLGTAISAQVGLTVSASGELAPGEAERLDLTSRLSARLQEAARRELQLLLNELEG